MNQSAKSCAILELQTASISSSLTGKARGLDSAMTGLGSKVDVVVVGSARKVDCEVYEIFGLEGSRRAMGKGGTAVETD